jgi:hypothetical protein
MLAPDNIFRIRAKFLFNSIYNENIFETRCAATIVKYCAAESYLIDSPILLFHFGLKTCLRDGL